MLLLAAGATCLAGCHSYAIRPKPFTPAPAPAPAAAQATTTAITGDPARLPDDVWRTIRDLNWGLMKLQTNPWPCTADGEPILPADDLMPATQPAAAGAQGPTCTLVEARALLADGRTARIHAWTQPGQPVHARIRVGELGDPVAEAAFLHQLQITFALPPRPVRGGYFDLPAYPPREP